MTPNPTSDNLKKILIVEDDTSLLMTLTTKLTLEGFAVLQAHNGQEGLDIAIKEHPDLILLDIIMPVMDGMTMFNKLQEDTWGRTAKIIFLTNVADNQKWSNVLGGQDYMVKSSWRLDDVVGVIKKKLGVQSPPISPPK